MSHAFVKLVTILIYIYFIEVCVQIKLFELWIFLINISQFKSDLLFSCFILQYYFRVKLLRVAKKLLLS